jgi:hypothetical protein
MSYIKLMRLPEMLIKAKDIENKSILLPLIESDDKQKTFVFIEIIFCEIATAVLLDKIIQKQEKKTVINSNNGDSMLKQACSTLWNSKK